MFYLVSFYLSFGKSKINRFSEYQDKAYDDQIAVNLRDIENRKSKLSTGSEDEEGKHEKVHMIYKYK